MENFQQLKSNSRKNVENKFKKKNNHWAQTLTEWLTDCPYGSTSDPRALEAKKFPKKSKISFTLSPALFSQNEKWFQLHCRYIYPIRKSKAERNFWMCSFLFYFHIKFSQFKINSSPIHIMRVDCILHKLNHEIIMVLNLWFSMQHICVMFMFLCFPF